MGVKGLFDIVKDSKKMVGTSYFEGKVLIIDASGYIYKKALGMPSISSLTDSEGNPTVLLYILMCNMCEFKKAGVAGVIFVLDNPEPNVHKMLETAKRKKAKSKAEEKIKKITDACDGKTTVDAEIKCKINKLKKQTFSLDEKVIADFKKCISLLGLPWITAPLNYEAEHLAAKLNQMGVGDIVMTGDSDALIFGAVEICRKSSKKKNKKPYEIYNSAEIFNDLKVDRKQLARMSVMLGTDFAEKTPRIGKKTVFTRGPDIKLTEKQEEAMKYMLSDCPFDRSDIQRPTRDLEQLTKWLVSKGFNADRVSKQVNTFK